jgi:hypothetical protein
VRHSLELRDELEVRGLLPRLAARAKTGSSAEGNPAQLVAAAVLARA